MENMECKRNLSKDEIINKFGLSSEEIDKCDKSQCKNLIYSNGIMECALLNK